MCNIIFTIKWSSIDIFRTNREMEARVLQVIYWNICFFPPLGLFFIVQSLYGVQNICLVPFLHVLKHFLLIFNCLRLCQLNINCFISCFRIREHACTQISNQYYLVMVHTCIQGGYAPVHSLFIRQVLYIAFYNCRLYI